MALPVRLETFRSYEIEFGAGVQGARLQMPLFLHESQITLEMESLMASLGSATVDSRTVIRNIDQGS
jgi:hypothetical protein